MPEYFIDLHRISLTRKGKIRKRDIADAVAPGRAAAQPVGAATSNAAHG